MSMPCSELDPTIVDQSGTKVAALVHLLQGILTRSGEKVLVFSQWPGVLTAIAAILDVVKIAHCVLLGPAIQRAAALEAFQVWMLSSKMKGKGLIPDSYVSLNTSTSKTVSPSQLISICTSPSDQLIAYSIIVFLCKCVYI